MITSRFITEEDKPLIQHSLCFDVFHKDTSVEFFYEEGTVCSVFSDEDGIILFARGKPFVYNNVPIIQLDLQYVDNYDAKRNMKAMLSGFPIIESRAKDNGFAGFLFNSNVPLLRKFCIKRLGFKEITDVYLGKIIIDSGAGDIE